MMKTVLASTLLSSAVAFAPVPITQIIIATSSCFENDQDCLRQVAEDIKKGHHKKGFNQEFKWQNTNYTWTCSFSSRIDLLWKKIHSAAAAAASSL